MLNQHVGLVCVSVSNMLDQHLENVMAVKQMFKALVMVELLDSEEEEETKGWGMTRSWLKKREELGYFTNVRELQLEETEGFKEMMRMDFKHFDEILNLIAATRTHRWK